MKFRTWLKTCIIDLADKFEMLPTNHPDRPHLTQMIASLRGGLDTSSQSDLFAGPTLLGQSWRPAWPLDHRAR